LAFISAATKLTSRELCCKVTKIKALPITGYNMVIASEALYGRMQILIPSIQPYMNMNKSSCFENERKRKHNPGIP